MPLRVGEGGGSGVSARSLAPRPWPPPLTQALPRKVGVAIGGHHHPHRAASCSSSVGQQQQRQQHDDLQRRRPARSRRRERTRRRAHRAERPAALAPTRERGAPREITRARPSDAADGAEPQHERAQAARQGQQRYRAVKTRCTNDRGEGLGEFGHTRRRRCRRATWQAVRAVVGRPRTRAQLISALQPPHRFLYWQARSSGHAGAPASAAARCLCF